MSTSKKKNPLMDSQREKSGPGTFKKYEYQYHWALFRALSEFSYDHEFVIFVELHEDVVLGNSLDADLARFEFNQVKSVTTGKYSAKSITRRPVGKGKSKKNSIIGKMLLSVNGKSFKHQIDDLNLVATCGFNLKTKHPDLELSLIKVGDLHEDCAEEIRAAIEEELGEAELPATLSFIKPDLPDSGFDHYVISEISSIVDRKLNGALCNATTIYRVLMDDLRKKGMVTTDFTDWDDLLRRKGLTNKDIENVTFSYTQHKDANRSKSLFEQICGELQLHLGKRTKLERSFGRYENRAKFEKSVAQLTLSNQISSSIDQSFYEFEENGTEALLKSVKKDLPSEIIDSFADETDLQAAIIYELILRLT